MAGMQLLITDYFCHNDHFVCSLYLSAVTSKGGQSFWIKVNGSGQKQAARLSDHNLLGSRCKLGVRRGGCSTGTHLLPLMQHRRKVRESIELADNRSSYSIHAYNIDFIAAQAISVMMSSPPIPH